MKYGLGRPDPLHATRDLLKERYPDCECAFAAGSLMRGEGTDFSDIDLVVMYPKLEQARRESFIYQDWPFEVFIHDPETLLYFFEEFDRKDGIPALPNMVNEGVLLPENHTSGVEYKAMATRTLLSGPPPLSADDILNSRYMISDALDDLRAPRNHNEIVGTGCRLYQDLGKFYLRSNNLWASHPKYLIKTIAQTNPSLAQEYASAFDSLFNERDPSAVFAVAKTILDPVGGPAFDGYTRTAPATWRRTHGPSRS